MQHCHTRYRISRWPDWTFSYACEDGLWVPVRQVRLRQALIQQVRELCRTCRPEFRRAGNSVLERLPFVAHRSLALMGERYMLGLSLLAEVPLSFGLLKSSPPLFAAVASYWAEGRLTKKAAAALVMLKERQVVHELGGPNAESASKIVRKFVECDFSSDEWDRIFETLHVSTIVGPLRHEPLISVAAARLLAEPERALVWSDTAFAEIVQLAVHDHFPWGGARSVIRDLAPILRRQGIFFTHCRTLRQAATWLKALDAVIQDSALVAGPELSLQGVATITTPRDLKAEGHQMGHCAASFVRRAMEGTMCFYRMFRPERLTIALERRTGLDSWCLHDVRGVGNAPPSAASLQSIKAALKSAGVLDQRYASDPEQFADEEMFAL